MTDTIVRCCERRSMKLSSSKHSSPKRSLYESWCVHRSMRLTHLWHCLLAFSALPPQGKNLTYYVSPLLTLWVCKWTWRKTTPVKNVLRLIRYFGTKRAIISLRPTGIQMFMNLKFLKCIYTHASLTKMNLTILCSFSNVSSRLRLVKAITVFGMQYQPHTAEMYC